MKKSKKLISLLLALVMLLSIIPMAAAADGTIVYGGVTLYTNTKPRYFTFLRNNAEGNVTKDVGESGVYQRLPRYTNICSCGRTLVECIPDEYSANAQKTVELSDPTVLKDLSFTISGWSDDDFYSGNPCLTFNYTAAKPGTTNVKLTFYYNYNFDGASGKCKRCERYANIPAMNTWLQETTTFTVTVTGDSGEDEKPDVTVTYTDGVENEEVFADQVYTVKEGDATPAFEGTPTRTGYKFLGWNPEVAKTVTVNATYTAKWEKVESVDKPTSRPSLSDRCYVRVQCVNTDAGHTLQHLDLLPSGGAGRYTVDTDKDGNVFIEKDGVWTYTITLNRAKFIESFCASTHVNKAPHTDLNPDQVTKMSWTWNAKQKKWKLDPVSKNLSTVGALIEVECDLHSVAEHTVTYTDGVDGAAFADQTYTVKEGDPTPAFDGTPAREGYVFLGWEPEVAETVTGDATYTATWEEALTEVKVTSSISEGALLYLGSEFKVTATANTDAKLTFNFEANPAFKQIASDATGNSKTVWYRVVKITGNYTKINVSVTGTKGNQEPVTGTLSFGVNLRNRIHVTIKNTAGEIISNVTNIKLNHKYPQWNTCPALKYDAAKQEYVMKNPWDLSSQEFVSVTFDYEGDTYETKVTKDDKNLFDVIRAGEEEIYVEYIVVDPICVTVEVDGDEVKTEKFKGNAGEKLNYSAPYWDVMDQIRAEGKMATVQILIDNAPGTEAIFGTNKNVKIVITTIG